MPAWLARVRPWLAVAAVVLIIGMLLSPLGRYAREYEFVESLQFAVFAVAAPALLVLGAPWRFLGLSRRLGRDSGRPPAWLIAWRGPAGQVLAGPSSRWWRSSC